MVDRKLPSPVPNSEGPGAPSAWFENLTVTGATRRTDNLILNISPNFIRYEYVFCKALAIEIRRAKVVLSVCDPPVCGLMVPAISIGWLDQARSQRRPLRRNDPPSSPMLVPIQAWF